MDLEKISKSTTRSGYNHITKRYETERRYKFLIEGEKFYVFCEDAYGSNGKVTFTKYYVKFAADIWNQTFKFKQDEVQPDRFTVSINYDLGEFGPSDILAIKNKLTDFYFMGLGVKKVLSYFDITLDD